MIIPNFSHRLAQTTPISTLMKNGFEMKVDNKKFQVEPASSLEVPASTLAVVDVQDLCAKAYFVKIRQRIAADKRAHVTYAYVLLPPRCFFFC